MFEDVEREAAKAAAALVPRAARVPARDAGVPTCVAGGSEATGPRW